MKKRYVDQGPGPDLAIRAAGAPRAFNRRPKKKGPRAAPNRKSVTVSVVVAGVAPSPAPWRPDAHEAIVVIARVIGSQIREGDEGRRDEAPVVSEAHMIETRASEVRHSGS